MDESEKPRYHVVDPNEPLSKVRAAVRAATYSTGIYCPCCGGWAKRYKYTINKSMAVGLMWLVQHYHPEQNRWVNVAHTAPRHVVQTNQLPTLRHWGLVIRPTEDPLWSFSGKTKHSGLWRPTETGIEFVRGRIQMPESVVTYKGEFEQFSGNKISIREAFDTNFDYQQAMLPVNGEIRRAT